MGIRAVKRKKNPYDIGSADPATTTLTAGAEAGNVIAVTIQLKTPNAKVMSTRRKFRVWLGTSATDPTVVATAPSGGIAATTGIVLVSPTANKILDIVTDATGKAVLNVTEVGVFTFYFWAQFSDGTAKYLGSITFA